MESISVCNHTMDEKNRKTAKRESDKYDYRQNWTAQSPVAN